MNLHNKAANVKMFINQAPAMSSGELAAMTLATRDMQQSLWNAGPFLEYLWNAGPFLE